MRFHGDQVVRPGLLDFAVNVWPEELDEGLRAVMVAAIDDAPRYPDHGPGRQVVAQRHGRPEDEVVLLNGASEAFWLLAGALRPRHAVCVHPSFTEPDAALRAAGVRVSWVMRDPGDWRLVPDDVPADADMVVVGNPNNPTGNIDPAEVIARLARPGRILVVDESFIELTEHGDESLAERRDLPGLVVVRSATKLWGLAGVRAGYLVAPAAVAQAVDAHRQPWSVNSVALAALRMCAVDAAGAAAAVTAARTDLLSRLAKVDGLRIWPAAANFVLVEAPGDGPAVVAGLRAANIAVRPAESFPGLGPDHIRLAVRRPVLHAQLVDALRVLLR